MSNSVVEASVILPIINFLLRANNIKCCYFINDSLVINRNYSDCRNESQLIVSELDKLGFTINLKKSILEPTYRIIFFGLLIDLVQYKVF